MKKLFFTIAGLMAFGWMSAQTDPKSTMPDKPVQTQPQKDTMSSNTQIKKESDMKTMDAVKTQDHTKVVRKKKTSKDTTTVRKNTRKGY